MVIEKVIIYKNDFLKQIHLKAYNCSPVNEVNEVKEVNEVNKVNEVNEVNVKTRMCSLTIILKPYNSTEPTCTILL